MRDEDYMDENIEAERTGYAAGIRAAAARLREVPDSVYPENVFVPPTEADLEDINKVLWRARGHKLDGVAAHIMRHAYGAAARMLDDLAADAEDA